MVLENEFTDIGCFLNELILDEGVPSSTKRLQLTVDVLESVLLQWILSMTAMH